MKKINSPGSGKFERVLPFILALSVLMAAFFFLLGGRFIPVIGSYY